MIRFYSNEGKYHIYCLFKNLLGFCALILVCVGCSAIIGSLPEPDPLWKAAVAFGPHNEKGCLVLSDRLPDCSSGEDRVSKYLFQFLPASPPKFVESLQKINFTCTTNKDIWQCSYIKSQPPVPCSASLRVSIEALFPSSVPSVKKLHLKVHVVPDPENVDDRGCFPM